MPNLRIDIDQDRANSLGIGNNQIGQVSQAAFAGLKVTELRDGDRLIPVVIRLRVEDRNQAEKGRFRRCDVRFRRGWAIPYRH